eukprot:CAMPEP_0180235224 /NCGR_PEP_ID=MMETSP0987-20121128/29101_1 /TAXON_ID=697907 /ORGANISM="non described non described, Strain CCMP2293" /LENGTH=525 /DNA_ID=CAMNT_0022201307 /DNA_START=53 /DNA_END=1630 /DNA_ORIENTATION=+
MAEFADVAMDPVKNGTEEKEGEQKKSAEDKAGEKEKEKEGSEDRRKSGRSDRKKDRSRSRSPGSARGKRDKKDRSRSRDKEKGEKRSRSRDRKDKRLAEQKQGEAGPGEDAEQQKVPKPKQGWRDRSRRDRSRSRSEERRDNSRERRIAVAAAKPKPPPPAPHPGLDPNFTAMIAQARQTAAAGGATAGAAAAAQHTLAGQQAAADAAEMAAAIPPGTNPLAALQIQLALAQQKQGLLGASQKQRQVHRRLYIGNLPIGIPGVEAILADFCNQAMIGAGLSSGIPGVPIADIWLSAQGTFGFVEFRSDEECTNGLNLNGVMFQGRALRVARPADYVDPFAPQIPNLAAGLLGMLLPAAARSPVDNDAPTTVLSLENMVTLSDLADPTAVLEINEDTVEECAKCGGVVRCMIPVPRPLAGQPALPQDEHVGKIFVEFKDLGGSARAKDLLHGRKFDGKSVIARYFKVDDFKVVAGDIPPPALPAAGLLPTPAAGVPGGGASSVPAAAPGGAYNPDEADVEGFLDPE